MYHDLGYDEIDKDKNNIKNKINTWFIFQSDQNSNIGIIIHIDENKDNNIGE